MMCFVDGLSSSIYCTIILIWMVTIVLIFILNLQVLNVESNVTWHLPDFCKEELVFLMNI
jgi:hypothetical protein